MLKRLETTALVNSTDLSVFMITLYYLNYYYSVIEFEIRECDASSFLILKIASTTRGLLWFQTNFRILCSILFYLFLEVGIYKLPSWHCFCCIP